MFGYGAWLSKAFDKFQEYLVASTIGLILDVKFKGIEVLVAIFMLVKHGDTIVQYFKTY